MKDLEKARATELTSVLVGTRTLSPIEKLIAQKAEIQHAMRAVMKEGEHYGVIPGTPKPSLWQPGADCLCFLFSFAPTFEIVTSVERDDLISYDVRCVLRTVEGEKKISEGLGACNSREKRYSSQSSSKICPECKQAAIIKGKKEYGGGWLCFKNKGGCGKKWPDGATEMEDQEGKATALGVWDLKNTILKMACKRAKVAAVLTATAASDCFTQDLEDLQEAAVSYAPPKEKDRDPGSLPARSVATTATTTTAAAPAENSTIQSSPDTSATGHGNGDLPPHDPETGEVYGEDPNGFSAHVEVYERMATRQEIKEDRANAPMVKIYKWSDRYRRFDQSGQARKLSQEQNRLIHVLREKLGHHLDLRVNPPASARFNTDGTPVKGEIKRGGKYYKKLTEMFGKDSTDQLSEDEAHRVIELLQGMVEKVYKTLDRGSEMEPGSMG